MPRVKRIYYAEVVNISKNSYKSKDRERSCEEKIRYKTEIKAARAAVFYNRRIVIRYSDVQSYDCRHCMHWHIGHDNLELHNIKKARMSDEESSILHLLKPAPSSMAARKRTRVLRTFPQRNRRDIAA